MKGIFNIYTSDIPRMPRWGIFFYLFVTCLPFMGCENDIDVINNITSVKELPNLAATDIEIKYTDSAKLLVKLEAPEIEQYTSVDEPYIEFPRGIHVMFYDSLTRVESEISSRYAIYYQEKDLWEARQNVVARNLQTGEQLNTELLYWDEKKGTVYSDKFTRITNDEGVFYGEHGFEADQTLSHWKLIGSKGTVNIEDEE